MRRRAAGPLVRAWPTQRRTRDAVLGLEVLRAIGSDTALMELSAVARKVRSPKVAQTAAGLLIAIARDRGLTAAMLDDRIVADARPRHQRRTSIRLRFAAVSPGPGGRPAAGAP
ncbi:MAG: hypothetical protein U0736_00250 [Gemmataceae bacterium]